MSWMLMARTGSAAVAVCGCVYKGPADATRDIDAGGDAPHRNA